MAVHLDTKHLLGVIMAEHQELWKKYRPQTFDQVRGQDEAVSLLRGYLKNNKVPHALLITGNSGIGKSTLAHIMAKEMNCSGLDLVTVNCATVEKPMDVIRSLQDSVRLSPTSMSTCRIWILEEIQSLSRASFSQQAMLMLLEDSSNSTRKSYIIACTTNPEKLKEAVRNRCKKIELKTISAADLKQLLEWVAKEEKKTVPESVLDKIIDISGGSAREAVNQLDSVLCAGTDEESMLAVLNGTLDDNMVWKLLKALFFEKPSWKRVAPLIAEIKDDPERFRHAMLKMAANEMIKNAHNEDRAARAFLITDMFAKSWEHCAESGLVNSCWQVIQDARR